MDSGSRFSTLYPSTKLFATADDPAALEGNDGLPSEPVVRDFRDLQSTSSEFEVTSQSRPPCSTEPKVVNLQSVVYSPTEARKSTSCCNALSQDLPPNASASGCGPFFHHAVNEHTSQDITNKLFGLFRRFTDSRQSLRLIRKLRDCALQRPRALKHAFSQD